MARFSKTAQGMKLAQGDAVKVQGVAGKVQEVVVMKYDGTSLGAGVLVVVDFTRGKGEPNVMNLSDIDAVRFDDQWVTMKGTPVAV